MDKKDKHLELERLKAELLYLQQKFQELMEGERLPLGGIVIFKPSRDLTLKDWETIKDSLYHWSALPVAADITPTLLELQEKIEKLYKLSSRDPLTGLDNRMKLHDILRLEVERARRTKQPLCVVFLDIDDFKKINDRHGHSVGDVVLKRIAEILKKQCRKTDFIFRYGGEEFVLILPATSLLQGEITCERIRKNIKESLFYNERGESFHVTVSMGISSYKGRKEIDPRQLLKLADEAMYKAKKRGKDQIVTAEFIDIEPFDKIVKVNKEEKQFLFSN